MLVSRTPLRVTLGGGGTDLKNGEGFCVAAAIDKYVTFVVNHPFTNEYVLRYSQNERVKRISEIQHSLFRKVLEYLDVEPGIEISVMADVPAGTGLGSSGAFTVGLLRALRPEWGRWELARVACELDTGQQDQYAAAYGWVRAFDFQAATNRKIDTNVDDSLQLFYTGVRREGEPVSVDPTIARDQAAAAVLALENDDPIALGACLTDQWQAKLELQRSDFHEAMDRCLRAGIELGAHGGKLVGAGNGGFLLFSGKVDPIVMRRMGLTELPFAFEPKGSHCV